jgi:hypothetical protein
MTETELRRRGLLDIAQVYRLNFDRIWNGGELKVGGRHVISSQGFTFLQEYSALYVY